jgi:hypothetical protein
MCVKFPGPEGATGPAPRTSDSIPPSLQWEFGLINPNPRVIPVRSLAVPFLFLRIFDTAIELSREKGLARRRGSAKWTASLPRRLRCTEHRTKRLSPLRASVPRLFSSEITLLVHESCLRYFARNRRNHFVALCVLHLCLCPCEADLLEEASKRISHDGPGHLLKCARHPR